eukprot:TRINITY_DN7905_c0_g2_i3.p1 TRINITY_DN7905_c0_g2~~TRINITY_DN7905_c0_g2_i3.p1  ORF type:complete len:204 (+),score=71.02 TRINITY_DN7905_c0_g2_i3:828-1439(+)
MQPIRQRDDEGVPRKTKPKTKSNTKSIEISNKPSPQESNLEIPSPPFFSPEDSSSTPNISTFQELDKYTKVGRRALLRKQSEEEFMEWQKGLKNLPNVAVKQTTLFNFLQTKTELDKNPQNTIHEEEQEVENSIHERDSGNVVEESSRVNTHTEKTESEMQVGKAAEKEKKMEKRQNVMVDSKKRKRKSIGTNQTDGKRRKQK